MSHVIVFVTASSSEEAARIGRTLVDEQLAACVNLIPSVASTYRWRGQVEDAAEALLIVKTRQDLVERLTRRVQALHSYTVPEVIALPVVGGNPEYLRWIDDSVVPAQRSGR